MSTSGDVQCIRGISMIHVEGYHEYIREYSVHRGDTMNTSGDIMSTSGGYQEYIGDVRYIGVFNRN